MVACRCLTWKRFVDGGAAEFVGLADADAALDAAAGHPHREAVGVVVAAGALGVFGGRLAAELAAPDDERLVEQPALLQILEQRRRSACRCRRRARLWFFTRSPWASQLSSLCAPPE